MTQTRFQPRSLSLLERVIAGGVALLTLVGAAIAGIFLLYVVLSLVALIVIVVAGLTIWRRFFAAKPSQPPGHSNMEIREDADGVIIDVKPQGGPSGKDT